MSESNVPNEGFPEPVREHPISPDIESDEESEESEDEEHSDKPRSDGSDFDPVDN